jgi:RimJ/RimL family protein N-acetyltransferase
MSVTPAAPPADRRAVRLEGARVVLRPVTVADVTERYCAWMNDPEVTRFTEVRGPQSRERITAYVETMARDDRSVFVAIVSRVDGVHIGNARLGAIDAYHRSAEIALVIGEKSAWGRGYATETIGLLVAHAFDGLGLHKVSAGCYASNVASIRAFLKAGFVEEARRPRQFWSEGAWVDHVWLGILNEERR